MLIHILWGVTGSNSVFFMRKFLCLLLISIVHIFYKKHVKNTYGKLHQKEREKRVQMDILHHVIPWQVYAFL